MKPKWGSCGGAWAVTPPALPDAVDVLAIRKSQRHGHFYLTQEAFAKRFGFTLAAVKDWEQGRRQPSRSALVLLTLISREPEAVRRALGGQEKVRTSRSFRTP